MSEPTEGRRGPNQPPPKPQRRGNPNWVKGVSGNPAGRPCMPSEMLEIARANSLPAFKRICELVHSKNEQVARAAADKVLDRAWGKPSQESTMHLHHGDKRDIREWTNAELTAFLDDYVARREDGAEVPHSSDGNETEH